MTRPGASEALHDSITAALGQVSGLNGVHEGQPIQVAIPYALIDLGPESDWSHKTGEGREVRLAVTIRHKGERPAGIRASMREAERAIDRIERTLDGWRIVTLRFLRNRTVSVRAGEWAGVSEYRARMIADD